jgi:hypothetical protein
MSMLQATVIAAIALAALYIPPRIRIVTSIPSTATCREASHAGS